jgi:hypothetical protein
VGDNLVGLVPVAAATGNAAAANISASNTQAIPLIKLFVFISILFLPIIVHGQGTMCSTNNYRTLYHKMPAVPSQNRQKHGIPRIRKEM